MITFLLLATLIIVSPALAQEPTRLPTDDEVNAVARQLYCPVCENTPLDVCPTQACAEWRNLIRDKLAQGWTAQQVKDYFVEQYGDRVLATPPARGLNWLVYIVPPLAFLAGFFILARALRMWRSAPAQAEAPTAPQITSDDGYVERLEEELRKM
ncbi:MAG: cytochrome c-type biogenesis protein CcmH [Anaerolineales bacterium]|nr:cytochrome c-type biogenesis protein CcmH [Anaerolineales bacterium]